MARAQREDISEAPPHTHQSFMSSHQPAYRLAHLYPSLPLSADIADDNQKGCIVSSEVDLGTIPSLAVQINT